MRWRIPNKRRQQMGLTDASIRRGSASLQIVLWTVWTLIVIAVGYVSWHADIVAQRPTNVLGLVIHCVVAGLIGLIIMMLIEMRVEPWRFIDDE